MYAIVRSGGKQYRVSEKTVFAVEKLPVAEGETVEITDVLMVADGTSVQVGAPQVAGARVTVTVVEHGKGPKIRGFTYKPAEQHRRHYGHRQLFTRLRVEKIETA